MSDLHICLVNIHAPGGARLAVEGALTGTPQLISNPTTAQTTTLAAPSVNPQDYAWVIAVTAGDAYVSQGDMPTPATPAAASSTTGRKILSGSVRSIGCRYAGEKLSVINA